MVPSLSITKTLTRDLKTLPHQCKKLELDAVLLEMWGFFPFPCSIENLKIERESSLGMENLLQFTPRLTMGTIAFQTRAETSPGRKNCRSKVKKLKLKFRRLVFLITF